MKVGIFGTSGFAREVLDVAAACGMNDSVFLSDVQTHDDTLPYPSRTEADADLLAGEGWVFTIGVGDNSVRRRIFERFAHLTFPNLIHPSATFGFRQKERFESTRGNIITAGVRFTNNIRLGNFGIFNLNCTVGHDCEIGDFVNLAPGANISGNVSISSGCYVGTNASVLQGHSLHEKLVLGGNSTIGMGSVVTKPVAPDTTVKGVPAR